MSLEAEMMLEQLKEQHLQETEVLQRQLESKVSPADKQLKMYQWFPVGCLHKTTLLAFCFQPAAKTVILVLNLYVVLIRLY